MGKMESKFRKIYRNFKQVQIDIKNVIWNSKDREARICARISLSLIILATIILPALMFLWILIWCALAFCNSLNDCEAIEEKEN